MSPRLSKLSTTGIEGIIADILLNDLITFITYFCTYFNVTKAFIAEYFRSIGSLSSS